MSKLQLNLDRKPFISKKFELSHDSSINIYNKPLIQKIFNKNSSKTSNGKSNIKTYKKYFIIDEDEEQDKNTYKFDFDYIISFENWEICRESNMLPEDLLKHLERLKTVQLESPQENQGKNKSKYKQKNNRKQKTSNKIINEENVIPEEFIKKLKEQSKKDPFKYKIIEYLNILAIDNYKNISEEIYNIIEDDIANQVKFLDILFNKSLKEKIYIKLYAKLLKDFDKKLPQRNYPKPDDKNKVGKPKKPTSIMRLKLLDKCRINLLKTELNEKINIYDQIERENKIKELFLGNIKFVNELINIQIISKKSLFLYIHILLSRYNEEKSKNLKMIYLEAIVLLLNNFGTVLKKIEKKMKEEDKKTFIEQINIYINKLGEIIEKEKNIVQYLKYKIINLIERSNNNWEETNFEKKIYVIGNFSEEEEGKEIVRTALKNFTQEEVTAQISKDLINFKEHILEDKGTPINYNWSIVENIYTEHGNTVAEMIQGFLLSCLDFVQNEKTLNLAKEYFTELIFYYKKSLSNKEKKEIVQKIIHLLKLSRKNNEDNLFFLDIWSIILSNLIRAHLFSRDDLLQIKDIEKEDIKNLFIIIAKIIKEDKDAKIHYDKCKFIQKNKELYEEALNEINS